MDGTVYDSQNLPFGTSITAVTIYLSNYFYMSHTWRNHYVIFDKGLPAPNFRKISLRNRYYVTTYEIPGLGVHIWGGSPQHHKYHYDSWWLIDDSLMIHQWIQPESVRLSPRDYILCINNCIKLTKYDLEFLIFFDLTLKSKKGLLISRNFFR